ncbi:NeuD/PglB/VioB family sugar acetyltransferase [Sphingomonas lacunae]|uniref:NeuD/PglB/VioB family sugar acetyltransferase n=1 Tax=Sphingomonas lacunae TaxID=2698828 RepID=A0A6M4AUJ4_9SPHN|nr:NeuD/PglB/VioB family sugar acetyltransferase [Sphingomonas lacunae]QJQ32763.1 NeuD/PglB/VioB family sugar acetyltransferase [Sphingomonas lacunae]
MSGKRDLFIVGTGGHAREVAEMALALNLHPVLIARSSGDAENVQGWDVVIESKWRADNANVAIGIGEPAVRQSVCSRLVGVVRFPSLVHPDASIGPSLRTKVQEAIGLQVMAGARLTTNIDLGRFVIINQNATLAHDCIVGNFVTIAPGANISGSVKIGDEVWVGTGAAINQGSATQHLKIGSRSTIGSGAVVVRDCEPDGVYVGLPAKRIK